MIYLAIVAGVGTFATSVVWAEVDFHSRRDILLAVGYTLFAVVVVLAYTGSLKVRGII